MANEQLQDEDAGTVTGDQDSSGDPPDPQADELKGEQSEDEPPKPAEATSVDEGPDQKEQDEPGSWRGEGGQYLTKEQHQRVREEYSGTARYEPKITASVQTAEKSVPDAQLVGLEYRLKGEERYKEKVAEKLAAQPLRDPAEIARSIHDAIRYTYQLPNDSYAKGYEAISKKLTEQGHEMVLSRNSWGNLTYKGINMRWRTPEGQLFEVQFHTPESFQAKQQTHRAYEAIRNPLTGESERRSLHEEQRKISSSITAPDGVTKLAGYEEGR